MKKSSARSTPRPATNACRLSSTTFSPELGPAVRNRSPPSPLTPARRCSTSPEGCRCPTSEFYDDFLARQRLPAHDYHYVAYVHGDLNAANILVDAHHNVWVIDFFQAGPGTC